MRYTCPKETKKHDITPSGTGHRWRLMMWTKLNNRHGQRLGTAMCLDCEDLTFVTQCQVPGQHPVFFM